MGGSVEKLWGVGQRQTVSSIVTAHVHAPLSAHGKSENILKDVVSNPLSAGGIEVTIL